MDFRSVATKMKDEIKRPPLPPVGSYIFQVLKLPAIETSTDGKWDFVNYQVRGVGVHSDVDEEELQKYGGPGKILSRVGFIFNKEDEVEFQRTEFQHRRFLEDALKCWGDGENVMQAMNNAVNKQFVGQIAWKADKNDPEVFHANITKTTAVE